MGFGGAMLALSAVKGISSIGQGFAQKQEDKYNDIIDQGKIDYLQTMGDIQQGQFARKASQLLSDQTANVAAKGLEPGGSAAAVMLDSQTQINTDMAIARFNQEQKIASATPGPSGEDPVYSGFSNAFTDLLTGASQYGMYKK